MKTRHNTTLSHFILLSAFLSILTSCAFSDKNANERLVNATLWTQTSAEYQALCYQTFSAATAQLKKVIETRTTNSKPLAVVVDIDDTVLNSSPYAGYQIKNKKQYPAGWDEWIDLANANLVPGVKAFLDFAHNNKVKIFYVSNRKHSQRDSTYQNLLKHELPVIKKQILLKKSKSVIKTKRRKKILKKHHVAIYVGDDLGDFSDSYNNIPSAERSKEVKINQKDFGSQYFVIPNPVYGDWEESLYRNQKKPRKTLRHEAIISF